MINNNRLRGSDAKPAERNILLVTSRRNLLHHSEAFEVIGESLINILISDYFVDLFTCIERYH